MIIVVGAILAVLSVFIAMDGIRKLQNPSGASEKRMLRTSGIKFEELLEDQRKELIRATRIRGVADLCGAALAIMVGVLLLGNGGSGGNSILSGGRARTENGTHTQFLVLGLVCFVGGLVILLRGRGVAKYFTMAITGRDMDISAVMERNVRVAGVVLVLVSIGCIAAFVIL